MIVPARTVEVSPRPSALITSLRGLGYSPETALADLIDNSIAAEARRVDLDIQWNDGMPSVAVLDDGRGMSEERLADAMRFGGQGTDFVREPTDLGRFGMGLKTASFSQCRALSVITRHNGAFHALTLDIDVIVARGWFATAPEQLPDHPLVSTLQARSSGTLVLWEKLDELSGLWGLSKEAFFLRLEEIRRHLGMIFHRFIDGDASRLNITLNKRPVKAWDPFQSHHPSTQKMHSEPIRHGGATLTVTPYVLPHRDRYTNEKVYDEAGGPGGWGARQGFYVYRGKRLLTPGSWLGLGGVRTWTRDETSRLARIQIDLPTGLDRDWRIDVRKSQARPPGAIRDRLTAIATRCRQEAREVFAFRGTGPRMRGAAHTAPAIWIGSPGDAGPRYRINRDHPAVIACRENAKNLSVLNAVLSIIERSVPVERIWLDVSDSESAAAPPLGAGELSELCDQLLSLDKLLPATMSVSQRLDALLLNLPGDLTALRKELTRKMGDAR